VRCALAIAGLFVALGCAATPPPTASPTPSATTPQTGPLLSPSTAASATPGTTWAITWPAPITVPLDESIHDVVAWQGAYVAAGEIIGSTQSQAAAWRSDDGAVWQQTMAAGTAGERGRAAQLLATDAALTAIGWLGVEHCPPGGEGAPPCDPLPIVTWTSTDGRSWTRHDLGDEFVGATFAAVATDGHGLTAVGRDRAGDPALWHSADGGNWSADALGDEFFQAHFRDVAWTGSTWLIGGSVGVEAAQSGGVVEPPDTKASIWKADASGAWLKGDFGHAAVAISELYVASDGVVAVGDSGGNAGDAAWRSADGTDWTRLELAGLPATSDGSSIVATAFATGDWHAYSISTDGEQWHGLQDAGELTTRPHWQARPQADNAFLIGDQLLVTSGDGLIWPAVISRP